MKGVMILGNSRLEVENVHDEGKYWKVDPVGDNRLANIYLKKDLWTFEEETLTAIEQYRAFKPGTRFRPSRSAFTWTKIDDDWTVIHPANVKPGMFEVKNIFLEGETLEEIE